MAKIKLIESLASTKRTTILDKGLKIRLFNRNERSQNSIQQLTVIIFQALPFWGKF